MNYAPSRLPHNYLWQNTWPQGSLLGRTGTSSQQIGHIWPTSLSHLLDWFRWDAGRRGLTLLSRNTLTTTAIPISKRVKAIVGTSRVGMLDGQDSTQEGQDQGVWSWRNWKHARSTWASTWTLYDSGFCRDTKGDNALFTCSEWEGSIPEKVMTLTSTLHLFKRLEGTRKCTNLLLYFKPKFPHSLIIVPRPVELVFHVT